MRIKKIILVAGFYFVACYLTYGFGYDKGYQDSGLDEQFCEVRFNDSSVNLINGFYSTSGYFCVLTRNRNPDEIARTTFHELAHYFVNSDIDHFCWGDASC